MIGVCWRDIESEFEGAIHTSELDRSECERSNANWDRSKILVWTAPKIDLSWIDLRSISVHFEKVFTLI